jgi:microcystin-dependent protein
MAIVINGSGTVTGISVGGLPDAIVDLGTLAADAVDGTKLADNAVNSEHLADGGVDDVHLASASAGLIMPFANTSAPTGFLACDGAAVSRTTYATLFAAVATVWGVGDGSSTFNVPDLRGSFVRGTGSHGTSNMAKGTDFAGAAVGAFENDQSQDHMHYLGTQGYGLGHGSLGANAGYREVNEIRSHDFSTWLTADEPRVRDSQGTPRVGDETRPFNASILYCIKY